MAKAGAGIGRPRKSSVWQYFEYNKVTKESTCTVGTSESGSICGKRLKGFYPTNLKKHLRQLHPNEYRKFEQNERERMSEDMEKQEHDQSSSQINLSEVVVHQKPYDKESQKNKLITTKLAIFLGATNIPLSIVESQEFRDLMHEMDKHYTVPQQKKIADEVEKVYVGLKERIRSTLERARRISICADIWSKPGTTTSFLGVTAHYYTSNDMKRHSVCLALRPFPSPHSGERVSELLKAIIDEWHINRCKLFRILTDNGSNMVAAFKKSISEMEKESQDVESEEEAENGVTQSQDQFNLADSEVEIKEEEGVEIADFESCEIDHRIAFTGWKRLSCFVHTLQLVVKVFEINPCFEPTLKKARRTVQKINKSSRATEHLLHLAGVELTKNCPKSTKWDSTFYMLSRLLEVKEHIIVVLDELAWDGFTHLQWKQLEDMKELLQPFAHFRNVSSSQKGTSIAMVVPVLKELNLHLEMFIDSNAQNSIISIARSLLEELGKRFAFVLDPEDVHFDGIYLAAVLLNPSYRKILNDVQISCAKKFLKDIIAQDSRNDANIGNEFNTPQTQDMQSEDKPPPKRFKHLSLVCKLLEKEENNTEVVTPSLSKEEEEIKKYIESTLSDEEKELDPLDFWIRVRKTYPLLYPVACDIMSTPASTAPVERIFLCSGEVTKSKRNRLTDSHLEREILLRKNTDYL